MEKYKVYKITNTVNQKIYIGYTKQTIDKRFKQHSYSKQINMPIVSAIKKYGCENFVIEEMCSFDNKQDAVDYEIKQINLLSPEYNVHIGGTGGPMYGLMNGMTGKKHSEDWKQKKSESMVGEKNPMYGKTHSDEVKDLLSKLKTGNIPWNKNKKGVYKEQTILSLKKPKSEEHKNKLKKTYTFTSPEGIHIEVFGLRDFCVQNNLNVGAMSEVFAGKRTAYKGWKK